MNERNKSVLIIEDDSAIRTMYEDFFDGIGISLSAVKSVNSAERAEDFLKKKSNEDLKLVLLNLQLPSEDGLTFLDKYKDQFVTKNVSVIVITGDTHPGLSERTRELGATICLFKPLNNMTFSALKTEVIRILGANTEK